MNKLTRDYIRLRYASVRPISIEGPIVHHSPAPRHMSANPLLRRKSQSHIKAQSRTPSPYSDCLTLVRLSANENKRIRHIPHSSSVSGFSPVRRQQVHVNLGHLLVGKPVAPLPVWSFRRKSSRRI